ncbi:MAG: hypothetical protein ACTSP1_05670, partial [Candidatus Freyarchaeota archaeon]
ILNGKEAVKKRCGWIIFSWPISRNRTQKPKPPTTAFLKILSPSKGKLLLQNEKHSGSNHHEQT